MKRSIFISSLNAAHLAVGSSEFRIAIFVLQVYDASFGSLRKLPKTYVRKLAYLCTRNIFSTVSSALNFFKVCLLSFSEPNIQNDPTLIFFGLLPWSFLS